MKPDRVITAALLAFAGCAQQNDLMDATYVSKHPVATASALNSDAVLGVERTLTLDGQIMDERVVDTGNYPENLAQLVESGSTDVAGHVYSRSTGIFSDGKQLHAFDHIQLVRTAPRDADSEKAGGTSPLANIPGDGQGSVRTSGNTSGVEGSTAVNEVISSELRAKLAKAAPGDDLRVRIVLDTAHRPKTSLERTNAALGFSSMRDADKERAEHIARIQARKDEVATLHADLKRKLESLGARDVTSFWLSGALSATMPTEAIPELAKLPGIRTLDAPEPMRPADAAWSGVDLKHTAGLSAHTFVNNGYSGNLADPNILVAVIDQQGFNASHWAFTNNSAGNSRVSSSWTCNDTSCSSGVTSSGNHGTSVAAIAAGDLRDHQVAGQTPTWELQRTGVCEECNLMLLKNTGGTFDAFENAFQKAVDAGADLVVHSESGGTTACDSFAAGLETTIYQAHQAGTLLINNAGNSGHSGACNVAGTAEVLSAFVVGGTGDTTTACNADGEGAYNDCDIYSLSQKGGIPASVNGTIRSLAISQIGAIAPACIAPISIVGGFDTAGGCGTSFSTPQVGGAAALLMDWHLAELGSSIRNAGVLDSWLLLMTDRAQTAAGHLTAGYNNVFGGGRFQMRYFGDFDPPSGQWVGADESGVWGRQTNTFTVSSGNADILSPMIDNAAEPSGLKTFKAYALFFEEDAQDIADVDLEVWKENCTGSTSNRIRSDASFDTKSMVYATGAEGASQKLCAKLKTISVPAGETRKVIVTKYYSANTDFR